MAVADNSDNGSLAGGLMGLRDPDLLMNVGLGLMSAAKYGGNVGDGLSQALGNYQQQKLRTQQMQMGQLELQRQKLMLGAAQGFFGQANQPGGGPPPPPQGAPQAPQGAPMGAPVQAVPVVQSQAPSFLQPPSMGSLYNTPVQGFGANAMRGMAALSPNPVQAATALSEEQRKIAALTAAPELARVDSVIKSDNPVRDIQADPQLAATWQHYAVARGLDPAKDLNDKNARQVFSGVGNAYRLSLGQPEQAPPEQLQDVQGLYGQQLQRDPVTNKLSEVSPMKLPTYSLEKVTQPGTNAVQGQLVQTGGWMGGPGAGGAGRGGGGINLGFTPASAENNKAAMFGSEMRAGLQTLNKMEGAGFQLSPKARAAAVSMATDESSSPMRQLLQQEIAARGLTADEQTYISAMMPLLQAAGHDQSGARLTTAQIRQNVEGLLPLGKDPRNLEQVQKNRDGFYQGLLSQAGPALQNPKYKSTLLADEQRAEQGGGTPNATRTVNGKTYYKQNGKWYAQ